MHLIFAINLKPFFPLTDTSILKALIGNIYLYLINYKLIEWFIFVVNSSLIVLFVKFFKLIEIINFFIF